MFLCQHDEHLSQLERDIQAAREAALDAVETDSIMTGTSFNMDDNSVLGESLLLYTHNFCEKAFLIFKQLF